MPGQIQVVKKHRRREESPVSEGFRDSFRDRHRLDPAHLQKIQKVGESALSMPEDVTLAPEDDAASEAFPELILATGALAVVAET